MRKIFTAIVAGALLTSVSTVNAATETLANGKPGSDTATETLANGKPGGSVATSYRATHFVSHRHVHRAFGGPPPADHDALYRWCRAKVIRTYGRRDPVPGEPTRMILPAQNTVQMADACMQSRGAVY